MEFPHCSGLISQLRHCIHLHRPIEAHMVSARADARGQGTGAPDLEISCPVFGVRGKLAHLWGMQWYVENVELVKHGDTGWDIWYYSFFTKGWRDKPSLDAWCSTPGSHGFWMTSRQPKYIKYRNHMKSCFHQNAGHRHFNGYPTSCFPVFIISGLCWYQSGWWF